MGACCNHGAASHAIDALSTEVADALAELDDGVSPCSAIIWMHGLGDTEKNWRSTMSDSVLALLDPDCGPCLLVTPLAPVAPVKCNKGRRMTCWFDMAKLPLGANNNLPDFGCSLEDAERSARRIHQLIDEVGEAGVPSDKVAVGGFSQGGAMALFSSLQYPSRLACCVVLSGILLGSDQLTRLIHPENKELDVLWCHGMEDALLKPSLQDAGCEALEAAGLHVSKRMYQVGHKAHDGELEETAEFLNERLRQPQQQQHKCLPCLPACGKRTLRK